MSIKPICIDCEKELDEPGAILLSPPQRDNPHMVQKFHICTTCWFDEIAPILAKRN